MKNKILQLEVILFFILILFGCKNAFIPEPLFPNSENNESETNIIPTNIQASHGLKQSIILTWDLLPKTKRYHIYQSNSPFSTFIQIGETKTNSYVVPVISGSTYYYKVSAINANEIESDFSIIVKGTSLATPEINAIEPITETLQTGLQVYWYMSNVDSTTYQNDIRYNITCSNEEGTVIEEAQVNGNDTTNTHYSFIGLNPNSNYKFQVTAYNVNDQKNVETSITTDAKTGKLLRPKPVENITATQGVDKEKIVLSFSLPSRVDVALGNGIYSENKLYFKIYRREYLENEQTDYQLICPYFGENVVENGIKFPNDITYEPGEYVEFVDNDTALERGRVYEYKIQSFADDTSRLISSDLSYTTTCGYKMGVISFGLTNYQAETGQIDNNERNISISSNFLLKWNNLGTENKYIFVLKERKYKLQSDNENLTDISGIDCSQISFSSITELNSYIRTFDLSTNELEKENRGYYKYSLDLLDSEHNIKDTINALGQVLVTGDTTKPEIKNFTVKDGFSDSFIISWEYDSTCVYELMYVPVIKGIEAEPITEQLPTITINDGETFVYKAAAHSGDSRKYILKAIRGIEVTTEPPSEPWETLGTPVPECPIHSYDNIYVQFKPVQKATSYYITAKYKDEKILGDSSNEIFTEILNTNDIILNSEGYITSNITQPTGYDNALISGKPIILTITAKSNASPDDGTNESRSNIETETLGPALSSISTSQANYIDKIQVKFNKIKGAKSYVVLRKQYNRSLDGTEVYVGFITYLINPENNTISLFGGIDTDISKFTTIEFNSINNVYTLSDKHITEYDSSNKWLKGQSVIKYGEIFHYSVIPVISENDFSYDETTDLLKIKSFALTNYAESQITKQAYALGYGNYITATKGFDLNSTTILPMNNTSITIEWQKPQSGLFEVGYNLYKRKLGESIWNTPLLCDENIYIDTDVEPGVLYEYLVGCFTKSSTLSNNPTEDENFINLLSSQIDTKRNIKKSIGYILPIVSMDKASRKDIGIGNVDIQWYKGIFSQGIENLFDGYVIEVLNMNVSSNTNDWKVLTHVPYTENTTSTARVNNDSGLLKILRDYKLYFRVRPYTSYETEDGEVYTYGIAPDYTWSDGFENQYVKWGARQISTEEFAKAALISMSSGIYKERGEKGSNDDGNGITGLKSSSNFNWGPSDYTVTFTFENYLPTHISKSGAENVYAITNISGILKARGGLAGQYQTHYWSDSTITLTYLEQDGTIKFNGDNSKNSSSVSRTAGTIDISWNDESIRYDMGSPTKPFTLPFAVKGGGYLNDSEEWK